MNARHSPYLHGYEVPVELVDIGLGTPLTAGQLAQERRRVLLVHLPLVLALTVMLIVLLAFRTIDGEMGWFFVLLVTVEAVIISHAISQYDELAPVDRTEMARLHQLGLCYQVVLRYLGAVAARGRRPTVLEQRLLTAYTERYAPDPGVQRTLPVRSEFKPRSSVKA